MTLSVPLGVSIGGTKRLTQQLSGLAFRKEAVGGVKSINLRLNRPLAEFDPTVAAFASVAISDPSASVIADGKLQDFGRTAGPDGQTWDVVAFGPAAHASDINQPLIVIDQSMDDGWRRVKRGNNAGGDIGASTKPNTDSTDAVVAQFPQGKDIATGDQLAFRYERIRDADQRLGRVSYDWDAGQTNADFKARVVAVLDNTPDGSAAKSSNWDTAGGSHAAVYSTDFTTGRNQFDLEAYYSGAGVTPANDKYWASFANVIIRAILSDKSGADQGCSTDYVNADWVVEHLLGGGWLPLFDGANASVDGTAAVQIDQLAYPDGVTAAQVLDDLMALEPAYYWTTGPADATTGLYSFTWKLWPTTVRYEAPLEDGGDFPISWTDVYNQVSVRWRDRRGRSRKTPRTNSGTALTYDRIGLLDVADELGSIANAQTIGDNWLAAHAVPPNAGNLTVARPIRDLTTGRMVQPFEIEPGELIRVRGVEGYADALNASSNDGQTVFRIWAMDYDSDTNSAKLELDTYPRNVAKALRKLLTRRNRKR